MNLTAGLILLFLNVFLPGLLFLRFYFIGEFSKQFSTKIPFVRLAFYAFLPGVFFLSIGLLLYNQWDENYTLYNSLEVFNDLISGGKKFAGCSEYFLKNQVHLYVYFTALCAFSSIILALLAHKIVRRYDLDIRFKILRFKNQWYYIFNGDILRFKKYKIISQEVRLTQDLSSHKNIMFAYVDVLVREADGIHLYSGIVMDYDLNAQDISKLDKLYLMDAHKHIPVPNNTTKKRVKTPIPGQIFVLNDEQILNINLTYVPSLKKKEAIQQTVAKRKKIWSLLKQFGLILLEWAVLVLLVIFGIFIFKGYTGWSFVDYIHQNFNVVQKIYVLFSFFVVLGNMVAYVKPDKKNKENLSDKKEIRQGLFLIISILLFIYLWELYLGEIIYGIFN